MYFNWIYQSFWRRKWQPISVFLLRESGGQRSLAGHGPWGCRESDMTEVPKQISSLCSQMASKQINIILSVTLFSIDFGNRIKPKDRKFLINFMRNKNVHPFGIT